MLNGSGTQRFTDARFRSCSFCHATGSRGLRRDQGMLERGDLHSRAELTILAIYPSSSHPSLLACCKHVNVNRMQILSRYKTWLDKSLPPFEPNAKVAAAVAAERIGVCFSALVMRFSE